MLCYVMLGYVMLRYVRLCYCYCYCYCNYYIVINPMQTGGGAESASPLTFGVVTL